MTPGGSQLRNGSAGYVVSSYWPMWSYVVPSSVKYLFATTLGEW